MFVTRTSSKSMWVELPVFSVRATFAIFASGCSGSINLSRLRIAAVAEGVSPYFRSRLLKAGATIWRRCTGSLLSARRVAFVSIVTSVGISL